MKQGVEFYCFLQILLGIFNEDTRLNSENFRFDKYMKSILEDFMKERF